ncbi:MAG: hypothetical protein Tsb0015_14460 [Simkaniaceae bacterium]
MSTINSENHGNYFTEDLTTLTYNKIKQILKSDWSRTFPEHLFELSQSATSHYEKFAERRVQELCEAGKELEKQGMTPQEITDFFYDFLETEGFTSTVLKSAQEETVNHVQDWGLIPQLIKNSQIILSEATTKAENADPIVPKEAQRTYKLLREMTEKISDNLHAFNQFSEDKEIATDYNMVYQIASIALAYFIARRIRDEGDILTLKTDLAKFPPLHQHIKSQEELVEHLARETFILLDDFLRLNVQSSSEQAKARWFNDHILDFELHHDISHFNGIMSAPLEDQYMQQWIESFAKAKSESSSPKPKQDAEEFVQRRLQIELGGEPAENMLAEAGLSIRQIVECVTEKKELSEADCYQVQHSIKEVRRVLNELAIQELLEAMQNDPEINEEVSQTFFSNWHEGEGGLIGADIKANQSFLSKKRRNYILDKARELSKFKETLQAELDKFQAQLNEDLRRGSIVVSERPLALLYREFFELSKKAEKQALGSEDIKKWKQGYQKIINDAWLRAEMKKRTNPHKITGSLIEVQALAALGYFTQDDIAVRERRSQAEADVFKVLLEGEGVEADSIEQLQKITEEKKLEARLTASGVCPNQMPHIKHIIQELEKTFWQIDQAAKASKENIAAMPMSFPQKAKKLLLKMKKNMVEEYNQKYLQMLLKDVSQSFQSPESFSLENLQAKCRTYIQAAENGSLYQNCDMALQKRMQFYEKYGDYIVDEMIQGLEDSNEVFDRGVCLAIALRWIMNQLRNPNLMPQNYSSSQILSVDRFHQLFHTLGLKIRKKIRTTDDKLFAQFPEKLRESLGIKDIKEISLHNNPRNLKETIFKELEKNAAKLSPLPYQKPAPKTEGGLGHLNYGIKSSGGGHAIAFRYETVHSERKSPAKFNGMIKDANIGTIITPEVDKHGRKLSLDEQKRWFSECMADSMEIMFGEISYLQFIQVKSNAKPQNK